MLRRSQSPESVARDRRRARVDAQLRRGSSGFEVNMSNRRRPGRSRSPRLRVRRLLILIACCLGLVLSGEILYALFHSYRFALREVRIVGVTPAAQPLIEARVPHAPGPSIFSLRSGRIIEAVKSLSFVERVSVRRRWPNILLVDVQERRPVAFCRQPWGIIYINKHGLAFSRPGAIPTGLPEIVGLSLSRSYLGKQVKGVRATAICQALASFARNRSMKLRLLEVDARGWMTTMLASGESVRLGSEEQLELKLNNATAVLKRLRKKQKVEYVDVSAPDAIVWKPVPGQEHKDGPT
jgi:cell division protein FtsQ